MNWRRLRRWSGRPATALTRSSTVSVDVQPVEHRRLARGGIDHVHDSTKSPSLWHFAGRLQWVHLCVVVVRAVGATLQWPSTAVSWPRFLPCFFELSGPLKRVEEARRIWLSSFSCSIRWINQHPLHTLKLLSSNGTSEIETVHGSSQIEFSSIDSPERNLETQLSTAGMLSPRCTSTETVEDLVNAVAGLPLQRRGRRQFIFSHKEHAPFLHAFLAFDSTLRTCSSSENQVPVGSQQKKSIDWIFERTSLLPSCPCTCPAAALTLTWEKQLTFETVFFQKVKTKTNSGNKEWITLRLGHNKRLGEMKMEWETLPKTWVLLENMGLMVITRINCQWLQWF